MTSGSGSAPSARGCLPLSADSQTAGCPPVAGLPRTCSPRCTPASMTRDTSAGRDPRQIRRVYNVWGAIDGDGGFLNGPAEQWIDELTAVAVEHGMDAFVFGPSHDPVHQVQHFAAETAPAVREAVARHRHQQSSRGADTPPPGHRM